MFKDKEVVLDLKIPVMDKGVEKIADVHIPHAVIDYDENSDTPLTIKEWYGGTMKVDGVEVVKEESEMLSNQKEIFTIWIPEDEN